MVRELLESALHVCEVLYKYYLNIDIITLEVVFLMYYSIPVFLSQW